jgi:hypothetical protein
VGAYGRVRVPAADELLVVEQVHRALDEGGAGNARARRAQRLLDGGPEVRDALHLLHELHVRRDERQLVDVLQRPAALERGGRCAAQQQERRLR